jgi:hypothetical protein
MFVRGPIGGHVGLPTVVRCCLSHTFVPKTFLRQVRLPYLVRYFQQRNIAIPWPEPQGRRKDIHALYDLIWAQDPPVVEMVEADWSAVADLTTAAGTDALVAEAAQLGRDVTTILQDARNGYERALIVLMEHPDVFDRAVAFMASDAAAGSRWHHRAASPGLPVITGPEDMANLEKLLRDHYRREGRGRNCRVEYHQRTGPLRHCFFAYPEDHPIGEIAYDERADLRRRTRRRAFEVAFVYRPVEGAIDVLAPGGKKTCHNLGCIFSAVTLGGKDEIDYRKTSSVNLDMFRDRRVLLATEPEDRIASVEICQISFRLSGHPSGGVTFSKPSSDPDTHAVYDLIEAAGESGRLDFGSATVQSVGLRATIEPRNSIRDRRVKFTLHAPDRCTLGERHYDQLLRKYLVRWGILTCGAKPRGALAAAQAG